MQNMLKLAAILKTKMAAISNFTKKIGRGQLVAESISSEVSTFKIDVDFKCRDSRAG